MTHLYTADSLLTGVGDERVRGAGGAGVVVDGDRIVRTGPAAELAAEFPDAARTDLPGHTLLPGLVDVHVHLGSSGLRRPRPDPDDVARHTAHHLESARWALSAGLTTVRNLGSGHYVDVAARDAVLAGYARGPRIVAAGKPITVTGGHSHRYGGEADTVEEIRRLARTHHKHGVDAFKVMATGGFMTARSAPWNAQYSVEELRVVVEEGARLGKHVAAHAHGHEGIRRAVEAGVDTVEHVTMFDAVQRRSVFDPHLADLMARRGTYAAVLCEWRVPRAVASGERSAPPVRELFEHGVPLVVGTDAGIPGVPVFAFAGALRTLVEFGVPPAAVLTAATSQGARAIGLGDVTGRLVEGFSADVLAVRGDPLADVDAYWRVGLVVARGEEFVPDRLPPLPDLDAGGSPA